MGICLRIKGVVNIEYEIGTADFFHCFFSTICYHLENKKWGSKYPVTMNNLYEGKFKCQYISIAINELNSIKG
jgi:2,3-bisphosphoglycerate-dependent phosphoglycerate mutase